ncbi:SRPBCC family protein [Microbacterium sp. Sa4CUA7]|uniref:SRPBCC family protein n=1 Tax=Microbacterium pullorum TaxID=2762236 RepID=A0ABR8S509_9MICO|nr:SRPBCC family protein [Microbacterium pullorum]MBD7958535.1 SRPBCC family protein [Microbacterium pullorum]
MTIAPPLIHSHGDGYRLVYEAVYATDIDDLWAAVTEPDRLARWMADYSGDLRLGGRWEVADADGKGVWCRGTVTSCDAPRGFTTVWHADDEEPTELVVRLAAVAGGTRLTLEHTGIRPIFYGAGWHTYLEALETHLARPHATRDEDAWHQRYRALSPGYEARFAAL